MQYLYWEKVNPPEDGPQLRNPYAAMMPLMKNWNEFCVSMRDTYDVLNGRGRGKVLPVGSFAIII